MRAETLPTLSSYQVTTNKIVKKYAYKIIVTTYENTLYTLYICVCVSVCVVSTDPQKTTVNIKEEKIKNTHTHNKNDKK